MTKFRTKKQKALEALQSLAIAGLEVLPRVCLSERQFLPTRGSASCCGLSVGQFQSRRK